jgi:hypothetical protein
MRREITDGRARSAFRRVHVTEHRDPRSDMGVGWVMVRKGNGRVCEFEHMQTDTKM